MTAGETFILSLIICLPLFIGLIKFKVTRKQYRPFLVLLLLGLITELINHWQLTNKKSNAVTVNIYMLFESVLIPIQFYTWGFFRKKKNVFFIMLAALIIFWIIELLPTGKIERFDRYFPLVYSFVVVLLCINAINYLIIHDFGNLLKNPVFIICIGFIIFFTYQIVYEGAYDIFNNPRQDMQSTFRKLNTWFAYINALANLLFSVAMLLVPLPVKINWSAESTKT